MEAGAFLHDNTKAPKGEGVVSLFSLKGRTAIVSGAAGGIGLGVAQALAESGANVAIWYNSNKKAVDEAEKIEAKYTVKCKAYQVNVTSPQEVDDAINKAIQEFNGRLDVFVANSGIGWGQGPFLDSNIELATNLMKVNFDGVMWCAKSAGAHFRRQMKDGTTTDGKPLKDYLGGSFIATASLSATTVNVPQMQAVYNASKAAVVQFCKSLAVEWTGFARVNTVSPGYIGTEMLGFAPSDMRNIWNDRTVMGRAGLVKEVAGAYVYLASDASSYTTGLDMLVDGGYSVV